MLFLHSKKTEQDKELLKFMKNILGFKPGNILLYKTALIHKSCSHTDRSGYKINNERLEYLGDTILSSIIGDYLFRKYPHQGEGFLTEMRSKIVSRVSLNALGHTIGLDKLLEYNKNSNFKFVSMAGDAFEAFTGALYLDKGYDFTYKTLINRIFTIYMDIPALETKDWNYKSKIIDWCQKTKHKISYEVSEVTTDSYRKQYKSQVVIDDVSEESAIAFSIKSAEQLASEKTYKKLIEQGIITEN